MEKFIKSLNLSSSAVEEFVLYAMYADQTKSAVSEIPVVSQGISNIKIDAFHARVNYDKYKSLVEEAGNSWQENCNYAKRQLNSTQLEEANVAIGKVRRYLEKENNHVGLDQLKELIKKAQENLSTQMYFKEKLDSHVEAGKTEIEMYTTPSIWMMLPVADMIVVNNKMIEKYTSEFEKINSIKEEIEAQLGKLIEGGLS